MERGKTDGWPLKQQPGNRNHQEVLFNTNTRHKTVNWDWRKDALRFDGVADLASTEAALATTAHQQKQQSSTNNPKRIKSVHQWIMSVAVKEDEDWWEGSGEVLWEFLKNVFASAGDALRESAACDPRRNQPLMVLYSHNLLLDPTVWNWSGLQKVL